MPLRRTQDQRGFTAIEAIVATFLFAVVVSSIVGVYISTVRINRKTSATILAVDTSRYLSEFLSKEIRNGQIDYSGPKAAVCGNVPLSSNPDYRIAIVNVDGDHECFYLGDNNGNASVNGKNLWMIKNSLSAIKLNPDNVQVSGLNVYLAPLYDPYCNNPPSCSNAGSNIQPRVTILGAVQSFPGSTQAVTIPLETTISLPIYDIVGQ